MTAVTTTERRGRTSPLSVIESYVSDNLAAGQKPTGRAPYRQNLAENNLNLARGTERAPAHRLKRAGKTASVTPLSGRPTRRDAELSFPSQTYPTIRDFFSAYADQVKQALDSVIPEHLALAEYVLADALTRDAHIFACGNGGSAAISNHLVCDHAKGVAADTGLRPRVQSLSATAELMTAIANDVAYDQVFAAQLALFGRPGDVLITISSSGDSPNVVAAIEKARAIGMKIIALTGFTGGRTRTMADVPLHVNADNYGVVEDVHQSLMHVLAQFIRMGRMPADLVGRRKF
jgi:phosphoheptose isomerase